jgi:21S rRNA (GM2251-2'-O)-methyltransferase
MDVSEIERLATELGVPLRSVSKHDLNMLSDNRPHQGVVLAVEPIELETLNALEAPPRDRAPKGSAAGVVPCWLALDEVVDPQNLGALLRSASFLGATGVVVCSKNSAALSPVRTSPSILFPITQEYALKDNKFMRHNFLKPTLAYSL